MKSNPNGDESCEKKAFMREKMLKNLIDAPKISDTTYNEILQYDVKDLKCASLLVDKV